MNNTVVILPYIQHNFSSFGVDFAEIYSCQFTAFTLNIVIKDPLFVTFYDILDKGVISLPWKKTCCYRYAIFLILLTKSLRNPNSQLAHFNYLFKMAAYCELGCNGSSANFRVLFPGLISTNSLKASWSMSEERFIFQWCIARTRLWIPVSDLTICNDTLATNTRNFQRCFYWLLCFGLV